MFRISDVGMKDDMWVSNIDGRINKSHSAGMWPWEVEMRGGEGRGEVLLLQKFISQLVDSGRSRRSAVVSLNTRVTS